MKQLVVLSIICLFVGVLFPSCNAFSNPNGYREEYYFDYFDTVSHIYDYSDDADSDFEHRSKIFEKTLSEYHKLFDIYNEYPGMNNLCTLNEHAGEKEIELDKRLIGFLIYAKDICEKTDGEVNIMMGSVLRLWHDARDTSSENEDNAYIPSAEVLERASEHISLDSLEIYPDRNTARISDPEASIDVGAIGKGYAVEKAGEALSRDGADGYVLDVGGNLKIIGSKPDGSGWKTGIRDPKDTQNFAHYLTLSDTSCVTSGDYERFFEYKGKNYHHIIDKDTLMPSDYFSSVTVITSDGGLADALSTALFCMSYEDGCALLKDFNDVEVIWITKDGKKMLTEGLK